MNELSLSTTQRKLSFQGAIYTILNVLELILEYILLYILHVVTYFESLVNDIIY